MAKQTAKKTTKATTKKKVDKPTAKKVVNKTAPKTEKAKPTKKVIKKVTTKRTVKVKKVVVTDTPTVIKKTFEKINLISHNFTEPNEHPTKLKPNKLSVSEINGIGGNTYLKFHLAGIKTVEDFANAGVSKISKILGWTEKGGLPFYLRGLAVYQNRVIKIKSPKNISQSPIYLDIETDLFQRTVWMIGIYITKSNEFIQLVADRPKDEPKIIKQCLEILSDHPNEPVISYSGSRFDERVLRKRFDEEKLKHNHLIFDDILLDIKASLAFPIKAYTLGNLGEFYGYNFKHPNMDGQQVAMLYSQYASDLKKFKGYEKLCDYNEDDVKSMASVVEHIYLK
jgi:predicted RecB family nuclease